MIIQRQIGPITSTSSIGAGTLVPERAGNMGESIVTELQARYYENTYRRNRFMAANPTGVTTVAFTSGTTTAVLGTILSNPVGATVNLVVDKVGFAFPVIDTTVNSVILAGGYNSSTNVTHTTALTVRNAFLGVGQQGQGLCDASSTVPTVLNTIAQLASMPTATTLPSTAWFDLEGSIILPPGAYIALITSAASAASGFQGNIWWSEVPV